MRKWNLERVNVSKNRWIFETRVYGNFSSSDLQWIFAFTTRNTTSGDEDVAGDDVMNSAQQQHRVEWNWLWRNVLLHFLGSMSAPLDSDSQLFAAQFIIIHSPKRERPSSFDRFRLALSARAVVEVAAKISSIYVKMFELTWGNLRLVFGKCMWCGYEIFWSLSCSTCLSLVRIAILLSDKVVDA